jgi:hypothetical protein
MHLTNNQYLRYYSNNINDIAMHDLIAIYYKVRTCILRAAEDYFVHGENHRFYPNPPKMSDLDIISLSITAECLQIDSESLLWSKLKKDYSAAFPDLIHRATFNRRRKSLIDLIQVCMDRWAIALEEELSSDTLIIDSMPIATCRIVREKSSRAFRRVEYDEIQANKGFNAIFRGYYIGYKFHLITNENGVYKDFLLTPASTSDNQFLKELTMDDHHLSNRTMLGDRGYIGKPLQLKLFDDLGLKLDIPYRRNQKDFKEYSFEKKIKRKTIEVVFSQYCDEFVIRRNYAKRFRGLEVRISTKVAAKTFKQYWNMLNGNPINQTKHALAA